VKRVLLVALLLGATGCFPVMTPPLKGDLGYAARVGGDHGYRFSVGTHAASLIPDRYFPLDVGGGYVQTSKTYRDERIPVHGVYLEGAPRVAGGKFWRVFVGPRAEYYFRPSGGAAYAGIVRTQIELFGVSGAEEALEETSSASHYWGVAFGVVAIGAYVEGGYQKLPSDAAYPLFGGGLLVRIPATAGIACCAWDFSKKK